MTPRERALLVSAAREAVMSRVRGSDVPPTPAGVSAAEPGGVFVTVRCGGSLRGCTGFLEPRMPLIEAVRRCAASAASEDSRFPPVLEEDLPDLAVEISILSPPRPAADPTALEIGRHGIIVARGARKGLLLPQVAVEHGFGVEEFLDAGCRKASLAAGAWRDADVTVELFTAEVFGDPAGPMASRPDPRD